jgi:hypothetical protein
MTNSTTMTSTPVLDALLAAHRVTEAARTSLRAVDWAALPGLLRALGADQSLAVSAILSATPDAPRDLVPLRAVLSAIGDRASRPRADRQEQHSSQRAVAALCAELVGLLGAATSLEDIAACY